jgi:hypothetical protein
MDNVNRYSLTTRPRTITMITVQITDATSEIQISDISERVQMHHRLANETKHEPYETL